MIAKSSIVTAPELWYLLGSLLFNVILLDLIDYELAFDLKLPLGELVAQSSQTKGTKF